MFFIKGKNRPTLALRNENKAPWLSRWVLGFIIRVLKKGKNQFPTYNHGSQKFGKTKWPKFLS